MGLTDNGNNFTMPVAPMGYGNGFGGNFGGDGGWWLLLLLFALGGGWSNGFGGFGGGDMVMPYMWNTATQNDVNRGFDTASLSSQLSGIQNAINSGFAQTEVSSCNRAMDAMQTAYNNQIASMNQSFAQSQAFENCCCENRLGLANLQSVIQTENCADRAAVTDGVRDILSATQAQTQTILDKLCQQEIDALKTQNANLQTQINMANLAASQTAQTARILSDNAAQTQALEQYLNPVPIPAYVVQNPNCCGNYGYNGCGCGVA